MNYQQFAINLTISAEIAAKIASKFACVYGGLCPRFNFGVCFGLKG